MKKFELAILLVSAAAAGAMARPGIFDRYDVRMTGWTQLPPEAPWGGDVAFSVVLLTPVARIERVRGTCLADGSGAVADNS